MMFNTKLLILLVVFQSFIYSQSGWYQQNSGTNKFLNSCFFLNDYTGFVACDDGLIIKTTNGGSSWFTVYNNIIYDMYSVYFINNATGWAGGLYHSESTDTNIVVKTTNGGQSWTKSIVGSCFFLNGEIYFINSLTGYLTGCNLKKTTNGGINWFTSFNNISSGVFFINSFTGWTGGLNNGLYKTTDEGFTWVQQITALPHQYNTDIYFLNAQTGFFILGSFVYGYLYTTTNSGTNWNSYSLPYEVTLITFPNQNTGYMLAQDYYTGQKVSKTTNGGLNWTIHNMNTSRFLIKIFFSSVNTGWAVGDSGSIFKTTNGGVSIGIRPISIEIPYNFSLFQNYPNPFNPNTKIRFDIPANVKSQTPNVKLFVYNLLGEEAAILVNQELKPGIYEADFDGSNLPSGTYFYRLQAGEYTETKKMVLLK